MRCHGGEESEDGAPPESALVHETERFGMHSVHVTENIKEAFACTECHDEPSDVLSPGHLFVDDDTPGVAEVSFTAGRAVDTIWAWDDDAAIGGCTNVYCHGNGQEVGEITTSETVDNCDACHAGPEAGEDAWREMSGKHGTHMYYDADRPETDHHYPDVELYCWECHADTVAEYTDTDEVVVVGLSEHIGGDPTISFVVTNSEDPMTTEGEGDDRTCTGTCHDEEHRRGESDDGRNWAHVDGGRGFGQRGRRQRGRGQRGQRHLIRPPLRVTPRSGSASWDGWRQHAAHRRGPWGRHRFGSHRAG